MKKLLLTAILLVLPTVAVAQPLGKMVAQSDNTRMAPVFSKAYSVTKFIEATEGLKPYIEEAKRFKKANPQYFPTDQPVIISFKGKDYYIKSIDQFEKDWNKLKDKDPCLKKLAESIGDRNIFDALLGSCETNMSKYKDRVEALGGDVPDMTDPDDLPSYKEGLKQCLINMDRLKLLMTEHFYNMISINNTQHVNLNECVSKLEYERSCHIGANTTGAHNVDIEKLKAFDWGAQFTGEKYAFPVPGNYKPGKALIFDGSVLIACQKDSDGVTRPKHVVHTAYSGLKGGCQSANYSGVARSGPIPDGIYLLGKLEKKGEDTAASWGGYRYPLIPAMTTTTYFRDSVYLHGTSKADKQQSAGCISLGTYIDEFVRTGWTNGGTIPVYVQILN